MDIVKKLLLLMLIVATTRTTFSQQVNTSLEIKIGNDEHAFIDKIRILDLKTRKVILSKDGSYEIENSTQKAEIVVKGGLINGKVSVLKEGKTKINYIITGSSVDTYKVYEGESVLVDAYRDKKNIHFKEYYPNNILKAEGWMSLDKKKHYGRGISKNYYEDGTLEKISNNITETYTYYYPNGNKKNVSGQNEHEDYNEDGTLHTKQYFKNKVRYVEEYQMGKLYIRSYENANKEEVKEYYTNGVSEKKEIMKNVGGSMRIFTYNKAGRLVKNELYEAKSPIGSE